MARHQVSFEEALFAHEDQARRLGAATMLLEQNCDELKDREEELRNWTRMRRSEFFLGHIRLERKLIASNGLKLEAEKMRLEIEVKKARSDVQLLAKGGRIVRL